MSNSMGLAPDESSGNTPLESVSARLKALRASRETSGEQGGAPGGRQEPRAPGEERRGERDIDQPGEENDPPEPTRAPVAAQVVRQEVPESLEHSALRTASWPDDELAEVLCELRREEALGIADLPAGPVTRWAELGEGERGEWAQAADRLRELLDNVGKEINSYSLCGQCGSISNEEKWELLKCDDGGHLVAAGPEDEDLIMRCPACGYDRVDDDADPGMWSGSHREMTYERVGLLHEFPDYAERWGKRGRLSENRTGGVYSPTTLNALHQRSVRRDNESVFVETGR